MPDYNIPEGFILDNNNQNLPDGFVLDQPTDKKRGLRSFSIGEQGQASEKSIKEGSQDWVDVFLNAFKNIPDSSKKFAGDIYKTVTNPIDTLKGISNLAESASGSSVLEQQALSDIGVPKNEDKTGNALREFLKERYGTIDNLKNTISKDPIGVLVDASTILLPIGKTLETAGISSKIGTIEKTGSAIEKIGQSIDPITATKKVIGKIPKLIPENVPSKLYQSAAKFSTVLSQKQRMSITNTALENRIMPTVKGLDKVRNSIDSLNTKISDLIDTADKNNRKIPIGNLFNDFKKLYNEANLSGEPISSRKAITNIKNQIETINESLGKKELLPSEIQTLKKNIYQETENFYSKMMDRPFKIKAKQLIARNAKESLEKIFPEIKQLNKKEGSLIELRNELEKSANRITNRDIFSIGLPIKGGLGAAIGHVPGLISGLTLGLIDTPNVKSKLAIVLNDLRKKNIKISPESSFYKLGIIAPERINEEESQ